METVWSIIKEEITKNDTPNSAGYLFNLNIGSSLFIKILPLLNNKEEEKRVFNLDIDVRKALINSDFLNTLFNGK